MLVTDGFTGNIFLKTVEGVSKLMMRAMKDIFYANAVTKVSALMVKNRVGDFKKKFDTAEIKLLPMITNVWINLPEEREADFRKLLKTLPEKFTMDNLLSAIGEYKNGISKPPTKYLLNLSAFPWDLDDEANVMFYDWDLTKD